MRALDVSGASYWYSGSALISFTVRRCSFVVVLRALIVVLVLLLLVQRRIFERDLLAGLESLEDLHAPVVGEAGDDHALLEELLPGVFVLLAVAGRLGGLGGRGGFRIERLLDEDDLALVALEDRLHRHGQDFVLL